MLRVTQVRHSASRFKPQLILLVVAYGCHRFVYSLACVPSAVDPTAAPTRPHQSSCRILHRHVGWQFQGQVSYLCCPAAPPPLATAAPSAAAAVSAAPPRAATRSTAGALPRAGHLTSSPHLRARPSPRRKAKGAPGKRAGKGGAASYWSSVEGWKPLDVGDELLLGAAEGGFAGLEVLENPPIFEAGAACGRGAGWGFGGMLLGGRRTQHHACAERCVRVLRGVADAFAAPARRRPTLGERGRGRRR